MSLLQFSSALFLKSLLLAGFLLTQGCSSQSQVGMTSLINQNPPTDGGSTSPSSAAPPAATTASSWALPPAQCSPVISRIDTSSPDHVVGNGPGTCDEHAFVTAVQLGGKITFNCGGAAVIPLTHSVLLRTDVNTIIDGGGLITLDGQNRTRMLEFRGTNFRVTRTQVTIQRLRFTRGRAAGSQTFAPAPAPCSQGYKDGGGGAILVNDGVLHVIDSVFENGSAATPGPDVAGGAIYVTGSAETVIQGSRFTGNAASNGGAVGSLVSDLTLVNNTFDSNRALGTGGNSADSRCSVSGNQIGSGGSGGAAYMDGGETFTVRVCGASFLNNSGNALGGAIFRVADNGRASIVVDRSSFSGNKCSTSAAMYLHNLNLTVLNSTLAGNQGQYGQYSHGESASISSQTWTDMDLFF